MEYVVHRAEDRGRAEHGWLHTRFSFSFAGWYEPSRMGFSVLRVLNDDVIEPHEGFGMHPHANMEIITIVTAGRVTHEDTMGHRYTVSAGDVQVMSAGTGVMHAEWNRGDEKLALFQVWIEPDKKGHTPRYEQKSFGTPLEGLELLVSGEGAGAPLWIHQNVFVYRGMFAVGKTYSYTLHDKKHGVYLFVIEGEVEAGGVALRARDAVGVWDADEFAVVAKTPARVILFEVPMK